MIPYEELDKALQRWKGRTQNSAADAAREFEESGSVSVSGSMAVSGSVPAGVPGLPPPADRTGEIDLGDSVVESYEEDT